jgi:hypothetical protein
MFRENKDHLQTELFNSYSTMNPKIQASLQGTWAPFSMSMCFVKSMRLLFPTCTAWITDVPTSP